VLVVYLGNRHDMHMQKFCDRLQKLLC
jgi:hypothetical protein